MNMGVLKWIIAKAVITGEEPLWPDLVVVKLLHSCPGFLFVGEGDKGVTSIVPIEVHHHPHLVDLTKLLTGAENARTLKKKKQKKAKLTSRDIFLKLFHNASPSHTMEPVHPQTDLLGVSPQRSHYLSQAVVRPSQVVDHRTAADRSPEEQNPKMRSSSMGRTPLGAQVPSLPVSAGILSVGWAPEERPLSASPPARPHFPSDWIPLGVINSSLWIREIRGAHCRNRHKAGFISDVPPQQRWLY